MLSDAANVAGRKIAFRISPMVVACRRPILLPLLALLLAAGLGGTANANWVFVTVGSPFRLDYSYVGGNQPGGQSTPFLAAKQPGGLIVGWVNTRSSTDIRPFAHYFSDGGSPSSSTPIQLGAATGPTAGALATAAFPLSFADGSALVLFAADRKNAAAAAKKDIFGQPLSASQPYSEVGLPASVNQVKPNAQDQVMATRLSNGNVMAVFLSHSGAASTFDLKGRVVNKNGVGVANEKFVTAATTGAQSLTSIAPLAAGKSVIAYVVRTGSGASLKQEVRVQRLDATGGRVGDSTLLKSTTGVNTYGGAGVAALSGGRFLAAWFIAGPSGTAILRGRVFPAAGVPGAPFTIGTSRISPSALTAPKIAVSSVAPTQGQTVIVTEGFAGGLYSLEAWLLNSANARLAGPKKIVAGSASAKPSASLIQLLSGRFIVSWTQRAASATSNRIFAQIFFPNDCVRGC